MIRKNHPLKYSEYVEKYAKQYEIPETLLYSVIKCESSFDPEAKSRAGARGLMQLMPKTFEEMARRLGEEYKEELMFDAETSIRYGSYYLDYLYNIFGDWRLVLAAYNGGMGNVDEWLKNPEYSDDGITTTVHKSVNNTGGNALQVVNRVVGLKPYREMPR